MQLTYLLIFVAVTVGVAGLSMLLTSSKGNLHDRRVRRLAAQAAAEEAETKAPANLLRKEIIDQSSNFRKQIKQLSNATRLTKLLQQSGSSMDQTTFVLLMVILGGIFAAATWLAVRMIVLAPAGLVLGGILPYIYLRMMVKRRMRLITEQLPDALEMLVSSLRSGQAFATALSTVATEMPVPISSEFRIAFDEQNFGVSTSDALEHLRERVDTVDMEFFVTAVTIQRETGGNLAEILDTLGKTIRGRLKLFGQIRTLTAQGRLSGWIVGALPAALGAVLYVLNPSYIGQLFTTELGNYMLGGAVVMQVCGFALIRKIVNIKV